MSCPSILLRTPPTRGGFASFAIFEVSVQASCDPRVPRMINSLLHNPSSTLPDELGSGVARDHISYLPTSEQSTGKYYESTSYYPFDVALQSTTEYSE